VTRSPYRPPPTDFEEAGYAGVTADWPDDPYTVQEAHAHPEVSPTRASARSPTTSPRSSATWSASPRWWGTPSAALNRHRAIPLTYDHFRYAFANVVSEEEAKQLNETYAVPGAGVPLFQAAAANLNPCTEAKVDVDNPGVTEYAHDPGSGHSLTIDSGLREVCDMALAFIRRFV
jgi:non-heme chloroperoxidase